MSRLSLARWLALAARAPCLDLRDPDAYAAGHLSGAVNIPYDDLSGRLHELPPRGERLFLYGPRAQEAARFLEKKPRWELSWSEEPLPTSGLSRETGPPLWKPSPWLAENCHHIPAGGSVFDAAMGTGRNAVFLAMRGYRVAGEDILPDAIAKARSLAEVNGVIVDARVGDLTRPDPMPQAAYDGVLVFNYLDRALFPALERVLAPGGVLIYETFIVGQEKLGSPKNPDYLLEPGELREAFPKLGIVEYAEGLRAPGRMTAALVARRLPTCTV